MVCRSRNGGSLGVKLYMQRTASSILSLCPASSTNTLGQELFELRGSKSAQSDSPWSPSWANCRLRRRPQSKRLMQSVVIRLDNYQFRLPFFSPFANCFAMDLRHVL